MNIDVLEGLEKIINKKKLSKLDIDYATDISYIAKGQNRDEILEYYGLEEKDLSDEDKKFLKIVIARTKTSARAEATKALFDSMGDPRSAASSALSYLVRFSPDWNVVSASDGNEKFTFIMKMDK